jgi:hypothetical protein
MIFRSIHDALIELSHRNLTRSIKEQPVVKILFDRGDIKQVIKNHQLVAPEKWPRLGLPAREDIKGIQLEVMVRNSPNSLKCRS